MRRHATYDNVRFDPAENRARRSAGPWSNLKELPMFISRRCVSFILGFGLLAFVAPVAPAAEDKPQHSAVKPTQRTDKGIVKLHESFLERAKKGDVDVLFLGDSITQGWGNQGSKEVWESAFGKLKPANFGIGGDRTQHVLWRITEGKELEGIQPKVVVLMIGTNNMGDNSAEQIADGVTAIVKELNRQKPHTKVLLLGIFPRSAKATDAVRDKIKDCNQRIAKLDDGKLVHYLDIGGKFLESDGSLSKDIMPDALHLSKKGYIIWADAIKDDLGKMLAGKE
jgi:lysophospholipase L1-like esterase